MKNLVLLLLFAVSFTACTSKHNPSTERQLIQMLDKKDLFRLQTQFEEKKSELSQSVVLYLEAHLHHSFNQTEQSLQTINALLGNYSKSLNDTLLCKIYEVKFDNLFKQSRYLESAEALKIAIDKYGYTMDSVDLADYRDEYNIIEPLKEFPPQKMHITTDLTIPLSHNKLGHTLMSVTKSGQSEDFVFDTGANLSVVSESCAQRMGIRVLESSSDIGNSTGSKVKTKVGIADSLRIGINFSYRFINVKKEMQRDMYSGPSMCFGINARITYVPFAVNNKNAPLSGGIWYMTIGITPFEIF